MPKGLKGLIQRFPSGLLPLLGIKASETPTLFGDEVGPSLDMLPLYIADRLEIVSATSAGVSASNAITLLPVPAGEFWYVHSMMALAVNVTAGSVVKLSVGVANPGGGVAQLSADQQPSAASLAAETYARPALPGTPLLLPSGWQIAASTLCDPGVGSLDLIARALIARLQPT